MEEGAAQADNADRMEPPTTTPGSELRRSVFEATQRIESIVDAAERVAEEIKAEATTEAEAYLSARRAEADRLVARRSSEIADLVSRVVERAEQLQGEAEAILQELRAATPTVPRPDAGPPQEPRLKPRPSTGMGAKASPGGPSPSEVPEEALLRATQMAVAGHERTEIERVLIAEFAVDDVQGVLDEILGPDAE
jgi:hypothetical protein